MSVYIELKIIYKMLKKLYFRAYKEAWRYCYYYFL